MPAGMPPSTHAGGHATSSDVLLAALFITDTVAVTVTVSNCISGGYS